uniref:Retrotransposon gag domain-containing protein n=1 Tax=Amphimedon queenslandica TaxID=400682 RepID=A0A1X7TRZ9_AMPQE
MLRKTACEDGKDCDRFIPYVQFAFREVPQETIGYLRDKQTSMFLAVCGSTSFELAKSLVQPDTLADTSFTDILGALKNHNAPEPSPIIQRFKFNSKKHHAGESIATYIAALRAIGEHCQFGPTLNDMIMDRLVCGVNDRAIQRRLLQESKLDYKTAYDIAIAIESASKNALDLFAGGTTTTHVKNFCSGLPSHSHKQHSSQTTNTTTQS